MTEYPAVTVVVPMYNDRTTIGEQLVALLNQDYPGQWEIVVADNGSEDGSQEFVRGQVSTSAPLRVVDASGVRGPGHARNVGARAGHGEIVAFTDADDVVSPEWLGALVAGLRESDLSGGPAEETALNPDYSRGWGDPPVPTDRFNVVFDYLPNARGNNIAVLRPVFEALGGWNEEYLFGEDIEFCWRAINSGYRLAFVPEAVVHYRRRQSLSGLARQQFFRGRQPHRIQLARDFGEHGLQLTSDAAEARRALKTLIAMVPASLRSRASRGSLIGTVAYGLGWVAGAGVRREVRRRTHPGLGG